MAIKADKDIEGIAPWTLEHCGTVQAQNCVLGLNVTFLGLAEFSELGRDASSIRPGYRRLETGSHVVFYKQMAGDTLIVRVLHARMDFERHL